MAEIISKNTNEHLTSTAEKEKNITVHEGKNAFQCEVCDKRFSQNSTMNRHIASIHEGIKAFKCDM